MAKRLLLALLAVLAVSSASWGGMDEMRFMQGIVSAAESSAIVLNERHRVNLDRNTEYFDSHGRPSDIQVIAERRWLYVEGAVESDGSVTAEKVYALPGHINKKNRHKYGFMQLP